jgi:diacylglycerol kinase
MRKHTISFKNASIGILTAARTQTNIRIHLLASAIVLIAAVYFRISPDQAIDLILTVGMVLISEMANTAIEFLSDAVTLDQNEHIKHAKDVAAGAVLISAIFAAIVGLTIFVPKIIG